MLTVALKRNLRARMRHFSLTRNTELVCDQTNAQYFVWATVEKRDEMLEKQKSFAKNCVFKNNLLLNPSNHRHATHLAWPSP
jgi:hypothetical protein